MLGRLRGGDPTYFDRKHGTLGCELRIYTLARKRDHVVHLVPCRGRVRPGAGLPGGGYPDCPGTAARSRAAADASRRAAIRYAKPRDASSQSSVVAPPVGGPLTRVVFVTERYRSDRPETAVAGLFLRRQLGNEPWRIADLARQLFEQITTDDQFAAFLTLPAYHHLD